MSSSDDNTGSDDTAGSDDTVTSALEDEMDEAKEDVSSFFDYFNPVKLGNAVVEES